MREWKIPTHLLVLTLLALAFGSSVSSLDFRGLYNLSITWTLRSYLGKREQTLSFIGSCPGTNGDFWLPFIWQPLQNSETTRLNDHSVFDGKRRTFVLFRPTAEQKCTLGRSRYIYSIIYVQLLRGVYFPSLFRCNQWISGFTIYYPLLLQRSQVWIPTDETTTAASSSSFIERTLEA